MYFAFTCARGFPTSWALLYLNTQRISLELGCIKNAIVLLFALAVRCSIFTSNFPLDLLNIGNALLKNLPYDNADELLEVFKTVQSLSQACASPYKYVCDWFKAQFPNYKKAPVFKDGGLTVAPAKAPEIIEYKQKMPKAS